MFLQLSGHVCTDIDDNWHLKKTRMLSTLVMFRTHDRKKAFSVKSLSVELWCNFPFHPLLIGSNTGILFLSCRSVDVWWLRKPADVIQAWLHSITSSWGNRFFQILTYCSGRIFTCYIMFFRQTDGVRLLCQWMSSSTPPPVQSKSAAAAFKLRSLSFRCVISMTHLVTIIFRQFATLASTMFEVTVPVSKVWQESSVVWQLWEQLTTPRGRESFHWSLSLWNNDANNLLTSVYSQENPPQKFVCWSLIML